MNRNDGGPAFPVEVSWGDTAEEFGGRQTGPHSGFHTGLSLRDYFASKALQGILAAPNMLQTTARACAKHGMDVDDGAAKAAYEFADAMIKAREN